MKRRTRAVLMAALTAAVVAAALPAAAQTGSSDGGRSALTHDTNEEDRLERIKQRAEAAIERRFETLDRLREAVSDARHISDTHAATLLAEYEDAEAGLSLLSDEIRTAPTIADAAALIPTIATDYRIYLVVVPKSRGVAASDAFAGASERLDEAATEVQRAIDEAVADGVDTGEAQTLLDGAVADGDAAVEMAGPVADDLIGLQASDWPDPAHDRLHAARDTLADARDLMRSAVDGLRAAMDALKG